MNLSIIMGSKGNNIPNCGNARCVGKGFFKVNAFLPLNIVHPLSANVCKESSHLTLMLH